MLHLSCFVLFLLAGFLVLPSFGELLVFRSASQAHVILVTNDIYEHNKGTLNNLFTESTAKRFVAESAHIYCSCYNNHDDTHALLDEKSIFAYWISIKDHKINHGLKFYQKVNISFTLMNSNYK